MYLVMVHSLRPRAGAGNTAVGRSVLGGDLGGKIRSMLATQTHRQAFANLVLVAVALLASAGLLTAAALAPAPAVVQPVLAVTCVAFAAAMASCAPASLAVVRQSRHAVDRMRQQLAALPEAEHPLGL
jgi:hypothetical protein